MPRPKKQGDDTKAVLTKLPNKTYQNMRQEVAKRIQSGEPEDRCNMSTLIRELVIKKYGE